MTTSTGPIEARPPASYGAPQSDVAALPSYQELAAASPLPEDPSQWTAQDIGFASAEPREATLSGIGALQGTRPLADDSDLMPVSVPPPVQVAPAPQPVVQRVPEVQPARDEGGLFAGLLPRVFNPLASRRPQASNGLPAAEAACRKRLKQLGVQFTPKPAVGNGGSCGIAHPVEVHALSGNVKVSPATLLNCQMAVAFAHWVKDELAPAVRKRYLVGIDTIGSMGGYSCRTMNSRRGAPMSEHASGNAIDIGSITLNSGNEILVRKKGFFAFRERSLLKNVRADGCDYFTTILGPGSDANHADHFHFDLRARKSGYRHCD